MLVSKVACTLLIDVYGPMGTPYLTKRILYTLSFYDLKFFKLCMKVDFVFFRLNMDSGERREQEPQQSSQ